MPLALLRITPLALCLAVLAGCGPAQTSKNTSSLEIKVLSNRADLISGGDVLVELQGVEAAYTVDVDGRDVTPAFATRADGRIVGLVKDLVVGDNRVSLRSGGYVAQLVITNHPIGGPIFSGEQIEPWLCTTEAAGLGAPVDAQCNASAVYSFYYRPNDGSGFLQYDPANPPNDVASVTTDRGENVPYVVRVEIGTQNRGIYRIAVLFDPARGWEPWAPQPAWNGKLHYLFGAGCGTLHHQGQPWEVLHGLALSRGFMVATSSLNVLGSTCNTTTSAEAVMMLKEHIVETYGEIRYTMAEGESGGAIGQHLVANSYPGLLQGIRPGAGYEDYWSTSFEVVDCHLLLNYFAGVAASQLWPDESQRARATGHADLVACEGWEFWFFNRWLNPAGDCGLESAYDASTNPRGCRATVQDFNVATLGRRNPEQWDDSPSAATRDAEAIAGGFARLPYDNAGIQYGLQALRDGHITAEQFVDLNEKVGGIDIDARHVSGRRHADAGSEILYASGAINDGAWLDQVAIVDLRPTLNSNIHTDVHSHMMRARLDRSFGHHANQVIWTSTWGDYVAMTERSFLMLDRWLAAVEADQSGEPLAARIVRKKPTDAVDTCFIDGRTVTDPAECGAAYPYYATPRLAAGAPLTNDVVSCQLKPLDAADYPNASFGPEQWARLRATFPDGVCDYGKPAAGRAPSQPWMTYADGPGGRPLAGPPAGT